MAPIPADRLATPWTRRRFLAALGWGVVGAFNPWRGCRREQSRQPLVFWEIWNTGLRQPMAALIDSFRECHPEIAMEAAPVATNNLKAKLVAAAGDGSLPDVFLMNSAWVQDLGVESLVDLRALALADGLDPEQLLRPADYRRCLSDTAMYCLPAVSADGSSMLFTNNLILERFGLPTGQRFANWEAFTEGSREVVARVNQPGDLEYIALDPFMGPGMVIHSSLAAGIGAPTTSTDGRHAQLQTEGARRAAHALDDYVARVYGLFGGYRALLRWRFKYAGQHRVPAFASLPYDRQVFAIAAAGSLSAYRRISDPPQVSVQPVPGLERLHGGMASHTWAYGVSRTTRRPREAWTLARFLTLEELGAGLFCREFGRPSPLRSTPDDDYDRTLGRAVWDGVKEAVGLDLPYEASAEDEYLRFHFYTVPMRRMRGATIDDILGDFQAGYQAYLDGRGGGVL